MTMKLGLVLFGIFCTIEAQEQHQQLQPEFRQSDEPQFTPPLPPLNNPVPIQTQRPLQNFPLEQPSRFQIQQRQIQQQQQFQQNSQQNFQQQQNIQQRPQQNIQNFQQRPQFQPGPTPNFQDFSAFRSQDNNLPTLPPVFIPPNTPIGPPPNQQSPIQNLFRQPSSNTFSISGLIGRFLNFFNLNSN